MEWSAEVLNYLAVVAGRSLILFAAAGAALLAFRVTTASARHAIWTVVAGGMLLLIAATPALPPVALHVLKAQVQVGQVPEVPTPSLTGQIDVQAHTPPARRSLSWQDAALAVYALGALFFLARLAFGYLFTRRLVRASTPIPRFDNIYSSSWISAPLTIGQKILLPAGWESWDERKLDAVLAHERSHVRRVDWAIALAAGVNRCIYWFHPLAWWLERRLAALAEEACDDSALLLVDSRPYAQALLDMAAAVKSAQGRLIWEAMAMAKAAEVRRRIERILDETRQIPRGLSRIRWIALLACSAPLVWLASVAQLAPAVAQEAPKTPAAMSDYLKGRRQLTPSDVPVMEQYLNANPEDIEVRSQLILYYYANGVREPRITHIVWLVANHPESTAAVFASQGVLPRDSSLNSLAEYQRVAGAWKQAVAGRQNSPAVLGNAAQFMQAVGELETAEALLNTVLTSQPGALQWKDRLAKLYAASILGATGDSRFPNAKPEFAAHARSHLSASEDGWLLFAAGNALINTARRPEAGHPLPAGTLNLDDHPLLIPAIDFGRQLLARAPQFGGPREVVSNRVANGAVVGGIIGGVPGGVSGGVPGGVIGGIVGGVPSASPQSAAPISPLLAILKRVEPVYPPLARQARISGVVHLRVTIGTDGTVQHMEIASGHPLLVPAAMEAVKQWVFQAAAAPVTSLLDIDFNLPPGSGPANANPDAVGKGFGTPAKIRVGSNVQEAKLIHKVDPVYPAQARAEGIEGSVTLSVTIGEDGQVQSAEPVEGNPILAAAAQEAVKQWGYHPTLLNNQPVTVITTVIVPFQLR